jgi:hypothetical protein
VTGEEINAAERLVDDGTVNHLPGLEREKRRGYH